MLLDCYRIKWIAIILNDFLPVGGRAARLRQARGSGDSAGCGSSTLRAQRLDALALDHNRTPRRTTKWLIRNSSASSISPRTRDYVARVTQRDKAEVAELAIQYDYDYWDGSRETGYGGYRYDGRWLKVAEAMVKTYGIKPGMRILDVGSGKGFLLHDFLDRLPRRRGRRHRHLALRHRAHDGRREALRAGRRRRRSSPSPTSISISSSRSTRCTISTTTTSGRRFGRSSASRAARNTSASRPIATSARR